MGLNVMLASSLKPNSAQRSAWQADVEPSVELDELIKEVKEEISRIFDGKSQKTDAKALEH